ncbi:MAG TPA: galactarate dehydratase [Rectinemataceae bacterium]|nr:galactarate dehydratase [Rectinemataceae bacterium]
MSPTSPAAADHPGKGIPILIRVDPSDNVAVVGNSGGLPAGTRARLDGGESLDFLEKVPEGHKVALCDIEEGSPILRYGETIGLARSRIVRGSWVEESLVALPVAPELDSLPIATRIPSRGPALEGYTFEGYRNPDGSVGTLNLLGISESVQCVAGVVDKALERIRAELLPKYPHVDGVVALKHNYGCGIAIDAAEARIPIRTLQNLARHPNLGGETMIVGLGCEKLAPERLAERSHAFSGGGAADIVTLQEHKGYGEMLRSIMERAEGHLKILDRRRRQTCPVSELVIGTQCGGSDALSGVTANPAVGFATDLLVRAGATVLFSEVTEVRDAIHLLTARAADAEVGAALVREMRWYDEYLAKGGVNRSSNTSPGNKRGGLANIVEKALGSVVKSGTGRIDGVLGPGERADRKGLIFAATPASDFICGTLQMASGIQLQVFTTGRGTPYGLEMIPVMKVGTRNSLAEQWPDLIDVNAGRIASGESSIEEVGWEIFRMILEVASGKKTTWAQRWGIHNDLCLFNPAPVT